MRRNNLIKVERRTDNSTYKKLVVQCSVEDFLIAESFVLRINICGKNCQLLESAKR